VIRNVAAPVGPPRVIGKEVQPLTPDEARRLLAALQTNRLQALFTVAVSLGLRQGEALALRWQDVDLEAGELRVHYALQRFSPRKKDAAGNAASDAPAEPQPPAEIDLAEPRTKNGRRTIELPNVTRSALAAQLMRQTEERRLAGSKWIVPAVHCEGRLDPVDDFVFTTPIGTPLDRWKLQKRFKALLTSAGIPAHRFHDLRHTAATLQAAQGVRAKTIQSVPGWDQIAMAERYARFVDGMRQDEATRMDFTSGPVAVSVAVKPGEAKEN
jgi:integrase